MPSAIQLVKLRGYLESDLIFSHAHMEKNFKGFFDGAQEVFAAFAMVNNDMLNAGSDCDTNDESKSRNDRNVRSKGDDKTDKRLKPTKNKNSGSGFGIHRRNVESDTT